MNKKNRVVQLICIVIILLNILNIYIILFPVIDYELYACNDDKYILLTATIVEQREKTIIYGKPRSLVGIMETVIKFEYAGKTYYKNIYSYSDYEVSNQIDIAYDGSVRRCTPYELTTADVIDLVAYILFSIFCFIVCGIAIKMKQVNDNLKEDSFRDLDADYEIKNYISIEEKKKKIMQLISLYNIEYKERYIDKESIEEQLKCMINEHFVWCLKYFSTSNNCLLFPFSFNNIEFDFIKATHELHIQGLPDFYYVISQKNGENLCGCAYDENLVLYSKGAGIMKTKYFDIYDYVIECLKSVDSI